MGGTRRTFGSVNGRKRKDGSVGSWRASYTAPDGSGRVTRDFPDRAKAEQWLEREKTLVEAANLGLTVWEHPSRRAHTVRDVTFHEWAYPWFQEHGCRHADGTPLAPATVRSKTVAYHRLDRRFGRRRMRDITVRDVNRMLDEGFGSRMATRNAYLLLKQIMRDASQPKDGSMPVIDRNPCVAPVPAKPRRTDREPPATPEQLSVIRRSMPGYTRIAIDVAVAFGLRAAEICALQVKDFNLEEKTLHLHHSVRRGEGDVGPCRLGDMKTPGSRRIMPIPEDLIPRLREHIDTYCDSGPEAMLVKPERSKVLNPNTLRTQFDRARVKAGRPDLRLHSLRATMITETVRQGAEPKETQELGRHQNAGVSLEYYQRAHGEQRQRDLINRTYQALMTPTGTRDINRLLERNQRELDRLTRERERLRRLGGRIIT